MSSDQPKPATEQQACENTDRELWREREGDYYADSIHVTKDGGIGINCGGHVFVKSLRGWHELAQPKPTTGEWTDYEARWLCERGWQVVKDRHNAALFAEREHNKIPHAALLQKEAEIRQLRDQLAAAEELQIQTAVRAEQSQIALAAEREGWQLATEDCHRIISRKNEELAAERQKTEHAISGGHAITERLRVAVKELAAEREKVLELTEQNKTFRAAQKACEDCDGLTMAEVQTLRDVLMMLEYEHGQELEIHAPIAWPSKATVDAALAKLNLTPDKKEVIK